MLERFRWVSSTNSTSVKLKTNLKISNYTTAVISLSTQELKFQNLSSLFSDDALREMDLFFLRKKTKQNQAGHSGSPL